MCNRIIYEEKYQRTFQGIENAEVNTTSKETFSARYATQTAACKEAVISEFPCFPQLQKRSPD